MLSSPVFAKLQRRIVPPGIPSLPLSSLATRHSSSIPFLFNRSSSLRLRRRPTERYISPLCSYLCPRSPSRQGGTPPASLYSRPPLDSISSIFRRPSYFSSTTYKMLLPQLLCFDNHPFSCGVYPPPSILFPVHSCPERPGALSESFDPAGETLALHSPPACPPWRVTFLSGRKSCRAGRASDSPEDWRQSLRVRDSAAAEAPAPLLSSASGC